MNDSDFIFEIQERIASYPNSMSKDDYWYFYNDFERGVKNGCIHPLSIISMNTNLLQKVKQSEKLLYEKTDCFVERSIFENFKSITVESEIISNSKNLIEMVNELISVYWPSSPLLLVAFDIISTILTKCKTTCPDIDQVVLIFHDQIDVSINCAEHNHHSSTVHAE